MGPPTEYGWCESTSNFAGFAHAAPLTQKSSRSKRAGRMRVAARPRVAERRRARGDHAVRRVDAFHRVVERVEHQAVVSGRGGLAVLPLRRQVDVQVGLVPGLPVADAGVAQRRARAKAPRAAGSGRQEPGGALGGRSGPSAQSGRAGDRHDRRQSAGGRLGDGRVERPPAGSRATPGRRRPRRACGARVAMRRQLTGCGCGPRRPPSSDRAIARAAPGRGRTTRPLSRSPRCIEPARCGRGGGGHAARRGSRRGPALARLLMRYGDATAQRRRAPWCSRSAARQDGPHPARARAVADRLGDGGQRRVAARHGRRARRRPNA